MKVDAHLDDEGFLGGVDLRMDPAIADIVEGTPIEALLFDAAEAGIRAGVTLTRRHIGSISKRPWGRRSQKAVLVEQQPVRRMLLYDAEGKVIGSEERPLEP